MRNGFTLIELMVCLALNCLIITLITPLALQLYSAAQKATRANDTVLTLAIALTVLQRDLKQATSIKEFGQKHCVFTTNAGDIGYFLKKGNLMRYAGDYTGGTWSRVSSSLLAAGVESIQFSFQEGVTCRLTKQGIMLTHYQALS